MTLSSKGVGLISSFDFLAKNAGPRTEELIAQVAGVTVAQLRVVQPQGWYDIKYSNTIADAQAVLSSAQKRDVVSDLRASGAYVAEDNLSTVYALVLKLASPARLLTLLPRMWNTYFRGITVEVQNTGPTSGRCVVRGLGTARHMSPIAAGWIELAYRKVGSQTPKIQELSYNPANLAPEVLEFDIRW